MTPTKKKYTKVAHLIPEVMQMRAEGKSITQIGEIMGLTKQRISQISQAAKIKAEIQAQWGWPFTTRTFNVLDRMAVKDKSEALSLYTSGHLHPNAVTGFGWKSYSEICEWLGVPVLLKRPKEPKLCPHCGKQI
jgi:hypothetical protein